MIYGFDWDGTLVETWTANVLPGVRERLASLPPDARTFIATNQAGPVFRAMIGDSKFPTVEDVAQRIGAGLTALDWRPDLLLVATWTGQQPGAVWERAATLAARDLAQLLLGWTKRPGGLYVSSNPGQRKPALGMLSDAGWILADGSELIYIGDMESDAAAAAAAGAQYLDAADWRRGERI